MSPRTRREAWMALAVGALEPGDAWTLLSSAGPLAAWRLATVRALAGISAEPQATVGLPGLAPLRGALGRAPLLSDVDRLAAAPRTYEVGSRLRVRIEVPGPAEAFRPYLLQVTRSGSQVLLPIAGRPWPTLAVFPEEGGARLLDLVVGPPAGPQELVVVLLEAEEAEGGWSSADALRDRVVEAVEAGQLPSMRLAYEVG